MAGINWDEAPSMTQGPSREDVVNQERQLNQARMALAGALSPLPVEQATNLPGLGGLLGGIAPFVAPEAAVMRPIMALTSKAPAVARPFIPSLAGSTAGTVAGTLGEQAAIGQDILSSDTGRKLIANTLENAAFDAGGNLVFSALGKTFKVAKGAFKTEGGLSSILPEEEQARRAAQEWLSSRNATLTKGQLTGDVGVQAIEGALKYSSGAEAFAKQQADVRKAIEQGSKEVMGTLDTSDAFQMALKQGDPTQMAVGDRFQTALKTAEQAMKDQFKPVYERVEKEGDGIFINMKPIKDAAQQELAKLAKRKFVGSGEDRAAVLRQILEQDDSVPLSVAHGLRSDLMAGARDLQKEGVATTAKEAEYNRQASAIQRSMDSVMVATFGNEEEKALARKLGMYGGIDSPAGLRSGQVMNYSQNLDQFLSKIGMTPANTANNELLRSYFNAQKGYGDAMKGFYSGTVSSALKAEPSAVGEYLFNTDRPERMRETFGAIAQMQKYLPAEQSKGLVDELRYGYLNKMLATPEDVAAFGKKLKDPTFKEPFNYLFSNQQQRKTVEDLANAANFGTETFQGSSALRTKGITTAIGAAETAALGAGAYLLLPKDITDKLDVTSSALSAGVLYLAPKMVSRALTNKEGMDALAMLAKAQKSPKFAGAASAKIADMMNKSGIINSEYLKESDAWFHGGQQGQQQQQQAPAQAPQGINWDVAPGQ